MRSSVTYASTECVFITAGPITKLFAGGGGGEWTTCAMIRRRAEACVDESAHHAKNELLLGVFITAGPITKLFDVL